MSPSSRGIGIEGKREESAEQKGGHHEPGKRHADRHSGSDVPGRAGRDVVSLALNAVLPREGAEIAATAARPISEGEGYVRNRKKG